MKTRAAVVRAFNRLPSKPSNSTRRKRTNCSCACAPPASATPAYNMRGELRLTPPFVIGHADASGPQFPGYRLHDIFVEVGSDPVSAHDYFNNPATLDMLADAMK